MSNYHDITCCVCNVVFGMPHDLFLVSKRSEHISWYCPYGHKQHFAQGESTAEKLRRERDRLAQRVAERDDALRLERSRREIAERSASAYKGQVTKIKRRVGNGVCPCCNRTFSDLQRHMNAKHPDYREDSNVLEFKAS